MRRKKLVTLIFATVIASSTILSACGTNKPAEQKTEEATDVDEDAEVSEDEDATEETEEADTSEEEDAEEDAEEDVVEEDEYAGIPITEEDVEIKDCVKLGEYKGLKLTKYIAEVSDDDVKARATDMAGTEEISDAKAAVKEGDIVNFDFVGTVDGKEFDGGSAEGYELEIGSGTFIDGFEDGMIGMKKGEEKDIKVTFPEEYGVEELNGKEAVFHVKVNSLMKQAEPTKEQLDQARKELQDQNAADALDAVRNSAWEEIKEHSEILQFRQKDLDEQVEEMRKSLDEYLESSGMTKEEYLKQAEMTEEAYEHEMLDFAKYNTSDTYIITALADAEKMSIEDPEQDEKEKELLELYGMTAEDLEAQGSTEAFQSHVLQQRLLDKILTYSEITEEKMTESEEDFVLDTDEDDAEDDAEDELQPTEDVPDEEVDETESEE